jgi:hypothetical protein
MELFIIRAAGTTNHKNINENEISVTAIFHLQGYWMDHLCGLVVRVLGYRSAGPGSIPGTTRKNE